MRALIAAAVLAAGLTVATPAVASANCGNPHYVADYRYMSENFIDGSNHEPTWRVMHELKFCNKASRGTRRRVDPIWLKVGCREHSGPVNWVGQRETRFNPDIWDRDGHRVNPGVWDVECNSSNWDTEKHYFRGHNWMHLCYSGGPRIDTHVEIEITADTNPSTRLSNAFWGYTGPVRRTC